jgi:hypothetical protein
VSHPLVQQLRFTRSEFRRALEGVSDADARKRIMPMNCIGWNIGHLAWQEQRYFLFYVQGQLLLPEINELFAYHAPASTPALDEMLTAWTTITQAVDPWLDAVTSDKLLEHVVRDGKPSPFILARSFSERSIIIGTTPARTWRFGRCWDTEIYRNSSATLTV